MIERRKAPRHRTLLGGHMAHNPQYSAVPCLVRDLSESGARLAVDPGALLPTRIAITIAVRAETRHARVVWRRGDRVGVAFADPAPETVSGDVVPLDLARRLRDSEAENRALRQRLADQTLID